MKEKLIWPMFNIMIEVKHIKQRLLNENELNIAGGVTQKELAKE